MKVAVVGAGIVGVATAYELALQQCQVTVFERRVSVATQGSFALPGLLAASVCTPWGLPGLVRPLLAQWLGPQPVVWARAGSSLAHLPWLWRHLRSARPSARQARAAAMQALAHASRKRLGELTQQLSLAYEQHAGGLVLISRPRAMAAVQKAIAASAPGTQGIELLDADAARALEPGLAPSWPLLGALRLPSAMVGNGRQLAHLLKAQAQRLGAQFVFDAEVRSVQAGKPARLTLAQGETQDFDAVVVCAGLASRQLLAGAGLRLPLLAPWGYAVTAPLSAIDGEHGSDIGPRAGVVDAHSGIAITRLGQRVRVTGVSQLGGGPDALHPAALQRLHRALESSFPGCAVTHQARHWKGPKPRVPDGAPVIGPAGAPGLWLNLGHGAHGWALATGAAQLLVQQLMQQPSAMDASVFSPTRFR